MGGITHNPVLMVLAIRLDMGMIETIAAPAITFLSGIAMQHWGYSVTSVALGLCIVAAAIPAVTMRELVTLPKPMAGRTISANPGSPSSDNK